MNKPAKNTLEGRITGFWYNDEKLPWHWIVLLDGLAWIYKTLMTATHARQKRLISKQICKPPVLVVGNLIAGGAGKTPIVKTVCQQLRKKGYQVGIVSRGFGRQSKHPVLIKPGTICDTQEVGDEPLFLSRETACPVAVSANRFEALQLLLHHYPNLDLIVSDDGLQHHRLPRSMEWVVFDDRGAGNKKLLPAGPLREDLSRLKSADWVIASNTSTKRLAEQLDLPVQPNWVEIQVELTGFTRLKDNKEIGIEEARNLWGNQKIACFTGIANPLKFFKTLQNANFACETSLALDDHYNYPPDFCVQFDHDVLIVTGKDAVKLQNTESRLWVAQIQTHLPQPLIKALEDCIGRTTD